MGGSGGKSGGAGESHDYFGSIAGLPNCGQLDFIWGLLVDDKLVWPKADHHVTGKTYDANSVVHLNGIIYETPSSTSATPPASPWIRFLRRRTDVGVNPYEFTVEDFGTALLYWGLSDQTYPAPDAAAGGQVETPVITITSQGDKLMATLSCSTSGATIKYQIQNSGNPPGASWTTYSAAVQVKKQKVLYAYALKTAMTDSAIASSDDSKEFLNANGHPPYRYRVVLALQKFLFGQERQTAPNVVVLGGRAPDQSLITGDAATLDADWQANPWCVIAELLTHPVIGLGIPAAEFDTDSFQDEADRLHALAATTYISPYYDRGQKVRAVIADLLSYCDLWIRRDPATGLYVAGHWPHQEAPPSFDATTTIDMHDLVEEIAWDASGLVDTSNATTVQFQDIEAAFKPRPASAPNLANRALSRRVMTRSLDRPFICRASQAAALAVEDARIAGDVKSSGTLTVRAEKATAITPGSLFELTDDALALTKICRCLRKTISAPPSGTVKLQFETERGIADVPYAATPPSPTTEDALKPTRIVDFAFIQLPVDLAAGQDNRLACLAARTSALITSFSVWWKLLESGDSFERLITQNTFSVAGLIESTVDAADVSNETVTSSSEQGEAYALDYSDVWNVTVESRPTPGSGSWTARTEGEDYVLDGAAGTIEIANAGAIADGSEVRASYSRYVRVTVSDATPTVDLEAITASMTADEIANDHLLLVVLAASDDKQKEILTVKSVEALGSGVYRMTVRRERFGTILGGDGSYTWTADDRAFFVLRSQLVPFTHLSFEGLREIALLPIADSRTDARVLVTDNVAFDTIPATKSDVTVLATANMSLTDPLNVVDGVMLNASNRMLLTGQSISQDNGIWVSPVPISKTAVRGVITSNLSSGDMSDLSAVWSADPTVTDNLEPADGDRFLLVGQTNQAENGIYVVNADNSISRASDADSSAEFDVPWIVYVSAGTVHATQNWEYDWTGASVTLGTTPLLFSLKPYEDKNNVQAVQSNQQDMDEDCRVNAADGITLQAGDRVLLIGQVNPAENGIYVVPSDGLLGGDRATDADGAGEFSGSWRINVTSGTSYGGRTFKYRCQGITVSLGTTPLQFCRIRFPDFVRATDADESSEFAASWRTSVQLGSVHAGQAWAFIWSTTVTLGSTALTFSQYTAPSALTTADGVSLSTGDRLLLVGQSDPAKNGLYVLPASGLLSSSARSSDADVEAEFSASWTTGITAGSHAGETWAFLWSQPVTLDTTPLTFVNRAAATSGTFRVTPATAWFESDVGDVYDSGTNPSGLASQDTFDFSDPSAPALAWTALFVGDGSGSWNEITDFSTTRTPGTPFRFEFAAADPNDDLDSYVLNARKGGGDAIILAAGQFAEGTGSATRGLEFSFAEIGEYTFELAVRDRSGRITALGLETLRIQDSSPSACSNPVFVTEWNKKHDHAKVTFTCATTGATIKYQKQDNGTPPNAGAWTTWTSGKVGFDSKKKVLYSYALKSGLSDSAVVSLNG